MLKLDGRRRGTCEQQERKFVGRNLPESRRQAVFLFLPAAGGEWNVAQPALSIGGSWMCAAGRGEGGVIDGVEEMEFLPRARRRLHYPSCCTSSVFLTEKSEEKERKTAIKHRRETLAGAAGIRGVSSQRRSNCKNHTHTHTNIFPSPLPLSQPRRLDGCRRKGERCPTFSVPQF